MKRGIMEILKMKGAKKVEILNITVAGFKNISKMTVSFGNITALVGLNGYGKSNVMDAIDFGFDFIHFPAEARTNMMSHKERIPILKVNPGRDFEFDIEVKIESKKDSYLVNYGYSFSWKTDKSVAKIKKEYLNIKKVGKNQKYNAYILRNETESKFKPSETARCSKHIKIEDNGLILKKLLSLDDLYYLDILQQLDSMQYYIERHLDASSSYIPAPFLIKGFQELELQGIQSIPRAIFYLKKDYKDKYELLVDAFKQLFPDVKDIKVQEFKLNRHSTSDEEDDDAPFVFTDSIYAMSIEDDKMLQPVSFESLSDGTKRIFLMLTFAVIADIKGLSMIAMEEPENSIHPILLQNYLDVLSQLVNKCKIVITSHSPYIIEYLNPRNIYVGLTSETGETNFRRIAASKVSALLKDAAEYDKSIGDYIFNLIADSEEEIEEYLESNG